MTSKKQQMKQIAEDIQLQRMQYIKDIGVKNFYEALRANTGRHAPLVGIDPKFNMLGNDRQQMMAEGLHQQRNDNIIAAAITDLENWTVGGESGKVIF
jgi:hypothetical protein